MRRIITLLTYLLPALLFAESGIYKTLEDFKANKLSQTCDNLSVTILGSNYVLTLKSGDNKETINLKGSGIWGFRRDMTDYRIIDNAPRAIATKGEIYVYSDAFDYIGLEAGTNDITYFKKSNAFPSASKGIDGKIIVLSNPNVLFDMMDKKVSEEVMERVKKFLVSYFMEDIADYYNSLRPGYLSTRYQKFYYESVNRTANGKRPSPFR